MLLDPRRTCPKHFTLEKKRSTEKIRQMSFLFFDFCGGGAGMSFANSNFGELPRGPGPQNFVDINTGTHNTTQMLHVSFLFWGFPDRKI